MTNHFLRTTSLAALSVLITAPAFADVTADDIWQNWKDMSAANGQTYTAGSETRSGDTLTITDLAIAMAKPDMTVTGTIPQVMLRELGDGRVEITMSNAYDMTMQGKDQLGGDLSNKVKISQAGLQMTASGTPDAISYDIAADTITINAMDFTVDGKPKDVGVDIDLSKLAATYHVTSGDLTGVNSTFAAQGLTFAGKGIDDKKNSKFDVKGQMNGIAGASVGTIPSVMMPGDLGAMFAQGFSTDGSFTYTSGNLSLAVTSPVGATTNVETTSQGGSLNISMDQNRIAYGGAGKGVTLKVAGTAIPFPELTAAYNEASFSLLMPIAKADEEKDFAVNVKLDGLTVSDMIWGMIDPGATLPRDPATLNIALKGKGKPLVNLLEVEKMMMPSGKQPFEVTSLDVDALHLSVAGAEFNGNGALAFDNSQAPVLGGAVPMPTGKLNLSLNGGNTLLGKLQAMGLVDPQMVMTFGMMMGMLAKPGPTDDSFVSEVEFQPGGKILTNGNPLPF